MATILLNDNEYSFDHIGLRKWLELEEIRETFIQAVDGRDIDSMMLSLCSYISTALGISTEPIQTLPWYEVANAYILISIECLPRYDFAVLQLRKNEPEKRKLSWDYKERTLYLWSHMIASAYGWTFDYISNIYFNDALALLQEIIIEEQLKREWEWSLSEIAYPYNESTKKSEFRPLPRPSWMQEILPEPKKVRIPKSMLPVGIVVRLGTQDEAPVN